MEQELEAGGESKGIHCNIKGSLEAYFELSMYESVPSDNRTLSPIPCQREIKLIALTSNNTFSLFIPKKSSSTRQSPSRVASRP